MSLCRASINLLYSTGSLSHNSAACPLSGDALIIDFVSSELLNHQPRCDPLIGFPQKTLQAQEDALHVVHGAPLILEDIQTDPAGEVDVRMVDGRLEKNVWRRVRVGGGEVEGEFELETVVVCSLGTDDGRRPVEQIAVGIGKGGDAGRGGHHQLHEFGLKSVD